MMIFVPVRRGTAERLRSGETSGPCTGFAATTSMLRAHGLDGVRDEDDAAFTAQTYAMTSGLLQGLWPDGARLVLAVEVADPGPDDPGGELGEVRLPGLGWDTVRAVFSDGPRPDPETVEAVVATTTAVRGSELGSAVDASEVEALLQAHDLLWHVPDETW